MNKKIDNYCKTKKSKKNLDQTVEFLKIIAEPNRLRILCILRKKEMCVCDIWQYLEISQNLASHHLKVLKDFKLIKSRKEGVKVIYSVNPKIISKYYSFLSNCIN